MKEMIGFIPQYIFEMSVEDGDGTQLTLFDLGERTSEFLQYHDRHPDIWKAFERKTFEAINRGFRNYGVGAIFELLRWETGVGSDGKDGFKLNNNWRAYYARLFEAKYPQHRGFFRNRESRADTELKA